MQGWRQSDGSLWKVNSFVRVSDKLLNIGGGLLISSITFSFSASGMTTTINVMKADGYKREVKVSQQAFSNIDDGKWKGVVK